MGASATTTYRLRAAWRVLPVAVILALGAIVWAFFDHRMVPFTIFIVALGWIAIVVWVVPRVVLGADDITVVNPFRVARIPYGAVTDITGGESMIITTADGKIRASAAGDGLGSPIAFRAKATFSVLGPIGANRTDLRRGEPDSPATVIANTIRRRLEKLADPGATQSGSAEPTAPRASFQLNYVTIVATLAALAIAVWAAVTV